MAFKKKLLSSILALGLFASSSFVSIGAQQLEVHHINVGQGDSTYVELPDGTDILVDSGKSIYGDDVVRYIKNQESSMTIDF